MDKPEDRTDPLHLDFTPEKAILGQLLSPCQRTMLAEVNSKHHLIPKPSHCCPDLHQQKFYAMSQLEFTAFHRLIYAMPGLATEKELNT